MVNILINGISAKSGGGKNILDNYLNQLSKISLDKCYYILVPDTPIYDRFESDNIKIIRINKILRSNFLVVILYYIYLPRLLKKLEIEVIFNFGDVIIPTSRKQIYFFDWPYAVYPDHIVWTLMDFKAKWTRKFKLYLIKKEINKVDLLIAQTQVMADRLSNIYGIKNIKILPTPLSVNTGFKNFDFKLDKSKKNILIPANYAPHKNFEILIGLFKILKKSPIEFKFILTLDEVDAMPFLNELRAVDSSLFNNLGTMDFKFIPSLYQQCDAVLLPSILETYGLPYIEAMSYAKPLIASDLDFAHAVCSDIAYYFESTSESSLLESLNEVFSNDDLMKLKLSKGELKVNSLPTWKQVFNEFNNEINFLNK